MNALTRWDPFKEMEETQNRLARIFGLTPARLPNGDKESMTIAEWAPSVDIIEDDKEWLVKADLPDVKKEDVKVTVENGVLTIAGERKFEKEEKDKKYPDAAVRAATPRKKQTATRLTSQSQTGNVPRPA